METILENESTVTDLVQLAQRGNRDAFGTLFERYRNQVFANAFRRLGNHSEAQELCQEVFVQALQKIRQLREPACFAGWLRSITHRMAINRMVRRRPDVATEPECLEATCAVTGTPLADVLAGERRDELRAGLDRLRSLDRETLVAFYLRGETLVEMSNSFRAPVGTIKRRLHVARKRLSKEVEQLAP